MPRAEQLNNPVAYPLHFVGLEFGTFRLKAGALEADMLAAARTMEEQFLSKEAGFLGHAILKGKDDVYVDLAFATSQTAAEEICGKWMQNQYALAFLEHIDHTSTSIGFYTRLL